MIKGAFGAGFAKGFGTTLAEGMKERRAQREKYVDLAIDNAKRVAPAYAQSEAEISTMEDMMDQMNNDFGVSPEEFIGLAQNYDIHDIYKNVYTAKSVMEKNGIVGQIDKSMILGSLALPANFKLPEGVTPEKALRQIFQGITVYTDPRNKSEQHRAGAFGKAVSDIMALNPRASAEEIVNGMKVAGVPVETLLGFEAGGGIKQTPFEQLKATGPYQNVDIDYTDAQYKTTVNALARVFSNQFTDSSDPDDYASLLNMNAGALSAFGANATANTAKREVFAAGQAMADLEKSLIGKGLTVGFGQANARYQVMTGLATRMDSVEDMRQFVKLVRQDSSIVDRIVEAYGNDQYITDEEFVKIMQFDEPRTEVKEELTMKGAPGFREEGSDPISSTSKAAEPIVKSDGTTTVEDLIKRNADSGDAEEQEKRGDRNRRRQDSDVPENVVGLGPTEEEPEGRDLDADLGIGYEERVPTVSMAIEREVRNALKTEPDAPEQKYITYEDWAGMSKAGRKLLGLDVSKVRIQNMTRGGKIPVGEIGFDPSPFKMEQMDEAGQTKEQLAEALIQLVKDGTDIGGMSAEEVLRMADRDYDYEARQDAMSLQEEQTMNLQEQGIMNKPGQDVTAPFVDTESPAEPVKSTTLDDLEDMIKRLHGSESKVAKDYAKLLDRRKPNYTQIYKFIKLTKKLPNSATKSKLLAELDILANKARR
jgi:plasmid maintenance system antidote protein VapI